MPLVKAVSVQITVDGFADAEAKLELLNAAADDFGSKHPEMTVELNGAKALIEAGIIREGIKAELAKGVNDSSGGGGFLGSLLGSSGLGPQGGKGFFSGLDTLGPGLAAITAIIPAIEAALVEVTGLVSGFAAAGQGVVAFGALAYPTFSAVSAAVTKIATDTATYDAATTKAARSTALKTIKADWAALTPVQAQAVHDVQNLETQFDSLAQKFEPMLAPIISTIAGKGGIVSQILQDLPPFANAAAKAFGPLLTQFDNFLKSPGAQKFQDAMLKIEGPAITATGKGIGQVADAIGKLLTTMSGKDDAHAIAVLFDTISGSISAVTWVVSQLMKNWDQLSSGMLRFAGVVGPPILTFFSVVVGAVKILADAVLTVFGDIINGAVAAFGWIPGIGPKLKEAAAQFDNFRQSVDSNLTTAQKNLLQWAQDIKNMPKIVKLQGDITDLQKKVATAEGLLKNKNLTAPQATQIKANITQLEAQIAKAKAELNALNGMTVTTYINTVNTTSYRFAKNILGHAAGGPASGLSLVGEMGPELVYTPPGSYVYNNAQTQQMMTGGIPPAQLARLISAVESLVVLQRQQNVLTAGVGNDVTTGLNSVGRQASQRVRYPVKG